MISRLKRFAPWVALVILGASVVACGGDDSNNGGSTGSATTGTTGAVSTGTGGDGNGDWRGEFETGTDATLTLWVDPTDPDLAEFEAFRKATGANPVLYGRVVATNDGSVPDTSRFVTLTGSNGEMFDGTAIPVEFLCSHTGRWIAAVATQSTELVNQYNALLANRCNGNTLAGPTIAPGETVTYYVAFDGEDEPEFERVFMGVGNELKR